MNKSNIKKIICDYISKNDVTSFVEIERIFEENNFKYKGELSQTGSKTPHVVFWIGWNMTAIEIIQELMAEERIFMEACEPIIYVIDGVTIDLPIPKKANFTKPHWIPVAFSSKNPKFA
ncbi:hypothetical protein V070_01815 [Staphylococcus aureus C0673]|nr:hypothetical protein V070_01815 [Staphylococcus aureus C0673]